MAGLSYGPRVMTKRVPIDPHDPSHFTIGIPQGAKAILKQAVEEYKAVSTAGERELALLDRFLANLGAAKAAEGPLGGAAGAAGGGGGGGVTAAAEQPADLVDEVVDAPQMFEYDDIAHSGHLPMKQVELVPSKKGKKEEEGGVDARVLHPPPPRSTSSTSSRTPASSTRSRRRSAGRRST